MTNFAFLDPEFTGFLTSAREAEKNALSAPRTSLFYARLTLEQAVRWMYDHDEELEVPYNTTLASLMMEPSFRALVPPYIQHGIHYIRKIGNEAIHSKTGPTKSESVGALKNLQQFLYWLAYTYGDTKPIRKPFEESLLKETPGAGVMSLNDIQKLAERVREKSEELKRKDKKIQASEEENRRLKEQLREFTARRKQKEPYTQPEDYSENETRRLFIDLLLREAGWDPKAKNVAEYPVIGMPNETGTGFADYVLWGDDGLPLAVVEAKKTMVDPHTGQHQAKLYADCLEKMHGRRPVIYYTNGFETWMWDDREYPPRPMMGFYSKDELQSLFNRRSLRKPLQETQPKKEIAGRYYQMEAVKRVCEDFSNKRRKTLLVMATGSGKTRTAASLIDVLARANWAQRILFLADRTALVSQAKRMISEQLPYLSVVNISKEKEESSSRMVFSTYPTMMNRIDGERTEGKRQYTVGYFDLVIVDEAHRSIYKKYAALFHYFDALWIGLTATPKSDIDKNTYEVFERDDHNPTFAYELDQAVGDKFLVPPLAASVPIKFPNEGISYKELSEEEKTEYEEKFFDEESGNLPDFIYPSALNDWLFNENTVDRVLQYVMENGLKVEGGDKLGKTIIFAKNHEHAIYIQKRFNILYPRYKGHFLRVIDNYEPYAEDLLLDFSNNEKMPQIAVSVDMLDTGIDIPELLNLVFFKRVRSSAKFWQMVGRGTRLCPDIFGPGQDKKEFYIFDFCENLEFFQANPDGVSPQKQKPLSQKIFEARLDLAQLLADSSTEDPYHIQLKATLLDLLHSAISQLDKDSIQVRPHLKYVIEFSNRKRWNYLSHIDINQIKNELAHLPETDDDESSKRFDLFMLQFMLNYLSSIKIREKYPDSIRKISGALLKKTAVPAVKQQETFLRQLHEGSFWSEISLKKLEEIRQNLRDLIKFLEKNDKAVVYTHFEDEITGDANWHELVTGITKLTGYKERVASYVRRHEDQFVIQKLKHNMPISSSELEQLEQFLFDGKERGTKEDFYSETGEEKPHGYFIRSIIGLDVAAAKEAFADFLIREDLNPDQITFINYIINFLEKNGIIEPGMLFDSPFTDLNDQGLSGIFSKRDQQVILKTIQKINENALVA
jgi:type I restriction enzyme R subunit